MKFTHFLGYVGLALLTALAFTSCGDDEMPPDEPVELITTLNYTLVPVGGGETVVLSYKDTDGDGGNEPVITTGTLAANTTYNGSLELLDESTDDVEDITKEIMEEDAEHQFFFSTTVEGLSIAYNDTDGNGNPIGLSSILTTGEAGAGNISIELLHEPDKGADGVSSGASANAGGESDIAVTFTVNVQ